MVEMTLMLRDCVDTGLDSIMLTATLVEVSMKLKSYLTSVFIIIILLAFAQSCAGAEGTTDDDVVESGDTTGPGSYETIGYSGAIMGYSVQGRPVIVERFGDEGPVLFLFHTIHGNEVPGEQLGQRMRSWLIMHPEAIEGLQVVYITQVNPDGYVANTRYNAKGIDLNRNFPASNFTPTDVYGPSPASEPETKVVVSVVEDTEPVAIVTVHTPLDAINYDGPAKSLATQCSKASGYVIDQDIGFYPGSFGSFAGIDLEIPTITLELEKNIYSIKGHDPGLMVQEVALDYVRDLGGEGVPLSEFVVDLDTDDGYESWVLGATPGGRPLLVERFGTLGDPVLVVAGLNGGLMSTFTAERLRALLLGRILTGAPQLMVLLITLANPDGAVDGVAVDDAGLAPDSSFPAGFVAGDSAGPEPLQCLEAHLLAKLVEEEGVKAAVVILSDQSGFFTGFHDISAKARGAYDAALYLTYQEMTIDAPGSLAAWTASSGLPTILMNVPLLPESNGLKRANATAGAILAALPAL